MGPSRRQVLAAMGAATFGGLAGCSAVTNQSFAANPVVLPEADQKELVLAETVREGETITRSGPAGIEVSIRNQASLYRRGPARGTPTVLERFTSMVNRTEGAGSAVSATGSDVGLEGLRLGNFEGVPDVRGDRFSLVMPAGARSSGGTAMHGKLMALIPGRAVSSDELTYDGDGPGEFYSGEEFLPDQTSSPKIYDDPSEFRAFLPNAEEKGYRIPEGQEVSGLGVEQVDPGITIDPVETVFASSLGPTPADWLPMPDDWYAMPDDWDRATPLLTSNTIGLAVLSTPTASVLGQSANPIVNMETSELLQHDATRRLLARAGMTDADEVEWLAVPQSIPWPSADNSLTLLGTETDLNLYVGVVAGVNDPWGVLLNVARVTKDGDHVITASTIRRPVGTADVGLEELWPRTPPEAVEFTAEAMGRLAVQTPKVG